MVWEVEAAVYVNMAGKAESQECRQRRGICEHRRQKKQC
jgi:hypothetical protein